MANEELMKIYPSLDIEVITLENENRKYYNLGVTCFEDILEDNIFYGATLSNPQFRKRYEEVVNIYKPFFEYFQCNYHTYYTHECYASDNPETIPRFEKTKSFDQLWEICKLGFQEAHDVTILVPSLRTIIRIGFDLQVVFYWIKNEKLNDEISKQISLLEKQGATYEPIFDITS